MLRSETTPAAGSCCHPTQKTEPTTGSSLQTDMAEVSYRIFRIHCGRMSCRYLTDPTRSPPWVQNRASLDSRRRDLRGAGLLRSAMADSRVSHVLRSKLSQ